jgi:hypothetical protein
VVAVLAPLMIFRLPDPGERKLDRLIQIRVGPETASGLAASQPWPTS